MKKWDRGVDYFTVYNILVNRIRSRRLSRKKKCYDSVLLIQLRNGLRISEAIRAYLEYIKTRRSDLEVPLSKKRKRETRLVVVPEIVEICIEFLLESENKLKKRIITYSLRELKINTHSLRYAFITHLLRSGVSPSIVAKITRHSKLDFILSYTQEKIAQDVLRDQSLF